MTARRLPPMPVAHWLLAARSTWPPTSPSTAGEVDQPPVRRCLPGQQPELERAQPQRLTRLVGSELLLAGVGHRGPRRAQRRVSGHGLRRRVRCRDLECSRFY
jgi:hypothetical protein